MSYLTLSSIGNNAAMQLRLKAALFDLTATAPSVDFAAKRSQQLSFILWWCAADDGWQTAWDAAVAAHVSDAQPYDPGADLAVISDAMIRTAASTVNQKL
ncbi:MAG: hypothetical protein L0H70_05605 [Xanthomonadales bacterium]|nr:hypothetical protein [Xanthomonadales bacterium]